MIHLRLNPLFCLLLWVALPLCAQAQAPSSCTQALYFYNQKQYSQALTLFDQCLMDHPEDGVNYYNRGKTWYELGHIDKALADFQSAIKLSPAFVQSYYALSEHYLAQRDEANAVKWINELLTQKPLLGNAYNLRGWIYFNFGHNQLAFTDFDKAINLDSTNASAYNNRASARYKMQDIEAPSTNDLMLAKADFLMALQLDPTLPNLHRNMGFIELSLGNHAAADSFLTKAMAYNPQDAMVYFYRGLLFAKANKADAAIGQMDKALQLYPQLGIALLEKGRLQHTKRRYADAVTTLNTLLVADPTLLSVAHFELARAYAAEFEREKMLEHLKLAQKLGFFDKLRNKQTFFADPAFQGYAKWGPYKEFIGKLRGI